MPIPGKSKKRFTWGRILLFTICTAGTLVALLLLATTGWAYFASKGYIFSASDVPSRPVAMVLGAGVRPDGEPSAFLRARLERAADLYRSKKIRVILVSGDNGRFSYDEPSAGRKYLVGLGIPSKHIVLDYAGFSTYESCVRARDIFGVTRLTIVTQNYHLKRAVATCRQLDLDAVGVGTSQAQADRSFVKARLREFPANVKAMVDVITKPEPTHRGPREDDIEKALKTHH